MNITLTRGRRAAARGRSRRDPHDEREAVRDPARAHHAAAAAQLALLHQSRQGLRLRPRLGESHPNPPPAPSKFAASDLRSRARTPARWQVRRRTPFVSSVCDPRPRSRFSCNLTMHSSEFALPRPWVIVPLGQWPVPVGCLWNWAAHEIAHARSRRDHESAARNCALRHDDVHLLAGGIRRHERCTWHRALRDHDGV